MLPMLTGRSEGSCKMIIGEAYCYSVAACSNVLSEKLAVA